MNTKAIMTDTFNFMGYVAGATAIMLGVPLVMYLATMWFV